MFQKDLAKLYTSAYFRKYEHRFINPTLISKMELNKNDRVIDIGCGNGDYTAYISKFVLYSCGIDFSSEAISIARKKYPKVHFCQADITKKLPFTDNSFNKAFCFHVLEHLSEDSISRSLLEIKRIIVGGGIIVFGTLNKSQIFSKLIKDCTHIREFRKKEFIELLNEYFQIIDYNYLSNAKSFLLRYLLGWFIRPDIAVKVRNWK